MSMLSTALSTTTERNSLSEENMLQNPDLTLLMTFFGLYSSTLVLFLMSLCVNEEIQLSSIIFAVMKTHIWHGKKIWHIYVWIICQISVNFILCFEKYCKTLNIGRNTHSAVSKK